MRLVLYETTFKYITFIFISSKEKLYQQYTKASHFGRYTVRPTVYLYFWGKLLLYSCIRASFLVLVFFSCLCFSQWTLWRSFTCLLPSVAFKECQRKSFIWSSGNWLFHPCTCHDWRHSVLLCILTLTRRKRRWCDLRSLGEGHFRQTTDKRRG